MNSPLSIPAFRRVWAGTTVSAAGDSASWIALVALCLGPTNADLPLLVVLYTAPVALGGLCAGWALDRFDRRRLLIFDSLARAAVFASIPAAMIVGPPAAFHLYAVAAVYGFLKMLPLAGFPALIPSLVPHSQLGQANALEAAGFGLASLAGAALAGLGVATVGAAPVVALDAVSYLTLAVALLSVRDLARTAPVRRRQEAGLRGVVRLVVSTPRLRNTTIMFALFNVGEGCLLVFLPHRAVDLGLGSGGYGYLMAAMTGGELLAAAFLALRVWRRSLMVSIVVAQLAAAAVVVALMVRSTATTLMVLVALGVCGASMTAWAQTLRMRLVPVEEHGRLFAVLRTTMQATYPLGAGLAAVTLTHGATVTVLTVAAIMGLPTLLTVRSGGHVGWRHAADLSDRRTDAGQRPTGRRQL